MELLLEYASQVGRARAIFKDIKANGVTKSSLNRLDVFLSDTLEHTGDKVHMDDIEPLEANHELEKNSCI